MVTSTHTSNKTHTSANPIEVRNGLSNSQPLHLVENRNCESSIELFDARSSSWKGMEHCLNVIDAVGEPTISNQIELPLVSMIQNASDETLSQLKSMLGVDEFRSLNGIPTYSGTVGEIIEDFFDNYELATEAKGWNDDKRKKMIPLFLKGRALSSYKWGGKEKKKYDDLKKYLIEHHRPADAESYYREQLHNRVQREGEDVLTYSYALLTLAARVEQYGGYEAKPGEKTLMDLFVKGLRPYYRKLVKEHNIKAERFEDLCDRVRIFEEASKIEEEKERELSNPKISSNTVQSTSNLGNQLEEVTNVLKELPEKLLEMFSRKRKDSYEARPRQVFTVEKSFGNKRYRTERRETRECYNCKRIGHLAADCWRSERNDDNVTRNSGNQGKAQRN